jgi:hypothetical protein
MYILRYVSMRQQRAWSKHILWGRWRTLHTIAVYSAVCAGLLPITLDLLPSTFIAGASHPPPLLHRAGGGPLRLVGVIFVDW